MNVKYLIKDAVANQVERSDFLTFYCCSGQELLESKDSSRPLWTEKFLVQTNKALQGGNLKTIESAPTPCAPHHSNLGLATSSDLIFNLSCLLILPLAPSSSSVSYITSTYLPSSHSLPSQLSHTIVLASHSALSIRYGHKYSDTFRATFISG